MAVAAVCRIEQLRQAFRARRKISGNRHAPVGALVAVDDGKRVDDRRRNHRRADVADERRRRCRHVKSAHEAIERLVGAERVNGHALGRVAHLAREPVFPGEPVDPRSEADALHDSVDFDVPA